MRVADPARTADAAAALLATSSAGDEPRSTPPTGEVRVAVADAGASAEAIRRLDTRGVPVAAVELQQPSLDDVFLTLTGRRAEAATRATKQEAA